MKILSVAMVSMLSISTSLACPNLEGSYRCSGQGYDFVSNVDQTGSGSNTVYTVSDKFGTEVVYTDGVWRNKQMNGITAKYRVHCSGAILKVEVVQNSPQAGEVKVNSEVKLDSTGNLQSTAKVSLGGNVVNTQSSTCVKI